LVNQLDVAKVQLALLRQCFQNAGAHEADVGAPRHDRFHRKVLWQTGGEQVCRIGWRQTGLQQFIGLHLVPAGELGAGHCNALARQIRQVVNTNLVGAGENHTAKNRQVARRASCHLRGQRCGQAVPVFENNKVSGGGEDHINRLAGNRVLQAGQVVSRQSDRSFKLCLQGERQRLPLRGGLYRGSERQNP
jgi:hypothetical protein